MLPQPLFYNSNHLPGFRLPTYTGKIFVSFREIIRLEGRRNYTLFVLTHGRKVLVSRTLSCFGQMLTENFVRIRRGCIINLDFVVSANEKECKFKDGVVVSIARRRTKIWNELSAAK
ncbi:MAG: LytTR family transcriptional regulator DNA-binding domain-containing protein [Runella sp.]